MAARTRRGRAGRVAGGWSKEARGRVIDLHSHVLPGIDDGAADLAQALEMARIAEADGIAVMACTPHITPGVFDNSGFRIRAATEALQEELAAAGIGLRLVAGADVHLVPDLAAGLLRGDVLSLGGSRYLLLEPPHHVPPPRFEDTVFELMGAGYVPVITHPERLLWIDSRLDVMQRLVEVGALMQVTAGSLTGRFGRRARHWAERLLEAGMVHVLATDAHDARRRPPHLDRARAIAAERVGEEEAWRLVYGRPWHMLNDSPPAQLGEPVGDGLRAHG